MRAIAVDLAEPETRGWYDALFESCPRAFIQQSTYWAEVIAELGPDTPRFLLCRDREENVAGLPLYLYRHPLGNLLTSVPQAGPLGGVFTVPGLTPDRRDAAFRCLIEAALDLARRYDCIALTLITNPFAKEDLDLYQRWLAPTLVLENFTQYIPLDRPARRSHGHRNNLNRAARAGYVVDLGGLGDLAQWYEIHRRRHAEIGASPLPVRLFENALRCLAPRGKAELLLVRGPEGLASGGLYVFHRDVTDVFMLSGDPDHLRSGANFLNTEHSLRRARKRGASIYNWQSSRDRTCGVYRYKQQWGSLETEYYFLTRLFCSAEYLERLGPSALEAAYAGHYVVPYAAFRHGFGVRYYRKGDV